MKKNLTLFSRVTTRAVILVAMASAGNLTMAQSGPDANAPTSLNIDSLRADLEQKRLALESEWRQKDDSVRAAMEAQRAKFLADAEAARVAWQKMAKDSLPSRELPTRPPSSINIDSLKAANDAKRD
ncbi:MAG TPA: hypothetical protein VF691_22620, partial [Cytophagaceae bacterium]